MVRENSYVHSGVDDAPEVHGTKPPAKLIPIIVERTTRHIYVQVKSFE